MRVKVLEILHVNSQVSPESWICRKHSYWTSQEEEVLSGFSPSASTTHRSSYIGNDFLWKKAWPWVLQNINILGKSWIEYIWLPFQNSMIPLTDLSHFFYRNMNHRNRLYYFLRRKNNREWFLEKNILLSMGIWTRNSIIKK